MFPANSSRYSFPLKPLRCLARLSCVAALLFVLSPAVCASTPASLNSEIRKALPSMQATYTFSGGMDGEVYPVLASYASLQEARQRSWSTVKVTVANSSHRMLRSRITVQVLGWTSEEMQMAEVGAGQVQEYLFAPTFTPRLLLNRAATVTAAVVTVSEGAGTTLLQAKVPLRIRSLEDIYWGPAFRYAPLLASWVTPGEPGLEPLLSEAKKLAPEGRLPGYDFENSTEEQERSTRAQVQAIYRTLQKPPYVAGELSTSANQELPGLGNRVRLPSEVLSSAVPANGLDMAVLYASLFERIGLDAEIVLTPKGAYLGLRLSASSEKYLYLGTERQTMSFELATESAKREVERAAPAEVIRISIPDARFAGILPVQDVDEGDSSLPSGLQ